MSAARLLGYAALALALAAAVVLALGETAWLLRLGIVAALWAALLTASVAVRARREAVSAAERADDMRAIYQLELEREVAARREHELTAERDLRKQIQADNRDELAALRGELRKLRESLPASAESPEVGNGQSPADALLAAHDGFPPARPRHRREP